MEELKFKDRDVVVPGDIIAAGMGYLPSRGTYREEDKVIALRVGLLSVEGKVLKVVPLRAGYYPKIGDRVIGRIIDVLLSGWRIDFFGPYSAVMNVKDATSEFIARGANLTEYFKIDEMIVFKIVNVTSQKLVDASLKGPGLRKLQGGRFLDVNPAKIPRIIGKEGSMVTMIKEATGVNITVGQNGVIWLDGTPEGEILAVKAIKQIEENAHLSGLTGRIKDFLAKGV